MDLDKDKFDFNIELENYTPNDAKRIYNKGYHKGLTTGVIIMLVIYGVILLGEWLRKILGY